MLLEEAQNIRSAVEQATERTQRAGRGRLGRLDIGTFGSAILGMIPRLLLAFRNAYPEFKIILHNMNKEAQIEALRQRRIDLGFNSFIEPSMILPANTWPRNNFGLLLISAINISHPLAQRITAPFGLLAEYPFILFPSGPHPSFADKVMGMFQQAGFTPQVAQEAGDTVISIALVASNFGVCLVPESATVLTLPGVVCRPLSTYQKMHRSLIEAASREWKSSSAPRLASQSSHLRRISRVPPRRIDFSAMTSSTTPTDSS